MGSTEKGAELVFIHRRESPLRVNDLLCKRTFRFNDGMIFRPFLSLAALSLSPLAATAHDSFLPLHHHAQPHDHGDHSHTTGEVDPKGGHAPISSWEEPERFTLATGAQYTRYSDANLWETGFGFDYAAVEWLHVGGSVSYGWFHGDDGDAQGWLQPSVHLDLHVPIASDWEVVAGLEVGVPGGKEELVGVHWEWTPHLELRYDRGGWYVETGASLAFVVEDAHAHEPEGPAEENEAEHRRQHAENGDEEIHPHEHSGDFHEIVSPHGERELHYFAEAGVRVLNKRLNLGARLSGVHVLAGESSGADYVRAGLGASWALNERMIISSNVGAPISDAARNRWQSSVGLRVGF